MGKYLVKLCFCIFLSVYTLSDSQYMCVININLDLNINNIEVKQVNEIKFLGVIIYCKLNWKLKLNYVSSKLSRKITILHSVKIK